MCFIAVIAACSNNLRAVNWRTVVWGMVLQVGLAVLILKLEIGGVRPGYVFFSKIAAGVKQFLEFTSAGSIFVFGQLANQPAMDKVLGPGQGFVFAFTALPTIIFVSSFFTVLYYFGVLQFIVQIFAKGMMFAMRTSGAETLSAAANVFMGQTEAPIIVKPYVPLMTQSELLAMMVGGMATISGGVMAVYISLGADPVAILTTSVMAAPCGLYLSKMLHARGRGAGHARRGQGCGRAPAHQRHRRRRGGRLRRHAAGDQCGGDADRLPGVHRDVRLHPRRRSGTACRWRAFSPASSRRLPCSWACRPRMCR